MEHTNHMGWDGCSYDSIRQVYITALETIILQKNTSGSLSIFYAKHVKQYFAATTRSFSNPPTIELIITSDTVASGCYVKINIDWSTIDVATKNNLIQNAKKELAGMRRITSDAQQESRKVELDAVLVQKRLDTLSSNMTIICILSAIAIGMAVHSISKLLTQLAST